MTLCSRCGSWAERQFCGLGKPCEGFVDKSKRRDKTVRRILRGIHPSTRADSKTVALQCPVALRRELEATLQIDD